MALPDHHGPSTVEFMRYVELHCKSNFSFLCGASHPDELVSQAEKLGYDGIALTDSETLAGVVRGYGAARDLGFKYIVGAEVHPADAPSMVLWPTDRAAYGRLCQLLSRGRLRCEKGQCELHWSDLVELSEGMIAGAYSSADESVQKLTSEFLRGNFRSLFGDRAYLLCSLHHGVDDRATIARYRELSRQSAVPLVASGDVHYHSADRMLMHDCVTAIRNGTTIDRVHEQRFANSQHHLKPLVEIERLFAEIPNAIERTMEIAEQCSFSLSELRYEYPQEIAPSGMTLIEHLKRLTWEGALQRWPGSVPAPVIELLKHEFELSKNCITRRIS